MKAGRLPGAVALRMHLLLALHWLRHELPQVPRSWWECHAGLWPPVKARRWAGRRWRRVCAGAYDLRWRVIAAVLNRVATTEMRHAAMLLGFDLAMGHGREGFLGHLHEYGLGNALGCSIRHGDPGEREASEQALMLELRMFASPRAAR